MGKQILFHALHEDCEALLNFLTRENTVALVLRDSLEDSFDAIVDPCEEGKTMCIWNRALVPSLRKEYVPDSAKGSYFRVDTGQAVLEMVASKRIVWNESPALLQGRIWGSFEDKTSQYLSWYEGIVRWIRRNFTKDSLLGGYLGSAALEWHQEGGILFPMFSPPSTPEWQQFVHDQQARHKAFKKGGQTAGTVLLPTPRPKV